MKMGTFPEMINPEIVKIQRVSTPAGEQQLRSLIQQHAEHTVSEKAKTILANWSEYLPKFWQVVPPSEKIVLKRRMRAWRLLFRRAKPAPNAIANA
jgi:Glutamate synthase domain 3